MAESLEQVLADERGDAAVLRRRGHAKEAELIERICDRVADAAVDFITFISESDAMLRSGKGVDYFKSRFGSWEREGLARRSPTDRRKRQYLRAIVPRRQNLDAIRKDAEETAQQETKLAS